MTAGEISQQIVGGLLEGTNTDNMATIRRIKNLGEELERKIIQYGDRRVLESHSSLERLPEFKDGASEALNNSKKMAEWQRSQRLPDETAAQWIIDNFRLIFKHYSTAPEYIFKKQNADAIKWITDNFQLIKKQTPITEEEERYLDN